MYIPKRYEKMSKRVRLPSKAIFEHSLHRRSVAVIYFVKLTFQIFFLK